MSNVNHPSHYNLPGRKECIEEMLDVFGVEALKHFCLLNRYKYLYRHTMKNGEEDLAKALWYEDKFLSLGGEITDLCSREDFNDRSTDMD